MVFKENTRDINISYHFLVKGNNINGKAPFIIISLNFSSSVNLEIIFIRVNSINSSD